MRNENKKPKKPVGRKNVQDRSVEDSDRNVSRGTGLIGEHDLSDTAERKIERTPHDKSSVTGSDNDGQTG